MSDKIYNSRDGAAFVQFGPGLEPFYIGNCTSVDSAPDPQPGKDPVFCIDENRRYRQVGYNITAPSLPGYTLTTLEQNAVNYMELIKSERCPFNLFLGLSKCYPKNILANHERAYAYVNNIITDDPVANPVNRNTDAEIEHAYNLVADYGRLDHRELTFARIATVEAAALNDITSCASACADNCSGRVEPCENLFAAADGIGAAIPDVLFSDDRGATWTSPATTYAANTSVMAVQCIEIAGGTTRIVTVRGTLAATPLAAEYSDDNGATWTQVAVGATALEAAVGGGSMFFLNAENGWICTDDGRVFFTDDAGGSWTDQTTALAASGAAVLNAIHFSDRDVGVAVGAGDVVIVTVDGGTNWTAGTATGSGDGLNTVHVFDSNRVIVGTDSGASASPVYMTYDWTANWTTITEGLSIAATDTVEDVTFMSDGLTGFLLKNTAAPLGTVYKSIDGGWSWQPLTAVTNSGLNSIHICNANLAFVVGEISAATSFIGQVSG